MSHNARPKSTDTIRSYHLNPALPQIMWVDLNSAFATAEQQAHPSLRRRPVGITNRISPECCIITASYEAKARGVKVGCRRSEALRLCPNLILLESDPPKYNAIYRQLFAIMHDYSADCGMKSIDEGYINLQGTSYDSLDKLYQLGLEIKQRVRNEIGDYMTINVGLGSNRFLAKLAAGLHKPDGLDIITADNLLAIYDNLQLEDLTGIAQHLGYRLRRAGITSPRQFLAADSHFLQHQVFHSINGLYWYRRLRGYEVDDYHTKLSVIGRQWVVDQSGDDNDYLAGCLHYLAENVGLKLRFRQVAARGVGLWLHYHAGERWQRRQLANTSFTDDSHIWRIANDLFAQRPPGRVRVIGLYLYNFNEVNSQQLSLLDHIDRQARLTTAIDQINQRYGTATIHSAHSSIGVQHIRQKVPFGSTNYLDLLID